MKTIPEHPNYAVTKDGRVWSKPRIDRLGRKWKGRWLTLSDGGRGYLFVHFYGVNPQPVHRLMLNTFIGPRPDGMLCRHLDGDKHNNHISNLCWGTGKENQHDQLKHGTDCQGIKHPMVKLKEEQVRVIFHAYHDGYYTQRELAKAFGISQCHVGCIVRKESWSHLWN